MPTITWLGDVDNPGTTEPDVYCTWGDYIFPVNVPVDVGDDPYYLSKAKGNRFFRVEEPEPAASHEPFDQGSGGRARPAAGRVDYDTFLDQPLTPPPAKRSHHKKKVVTDDADH